MTPDKELPIAEESYDALVMVGVFCPGHFPMEIGTFKQLLRIVKKGVYLGLFSFYTFSTEFILSSQVE